MKEWKENKKKFKAKARSLAKEIKDGEVRIKEEQEAMLKEKAEVKRKEIKAYLEELKVLQEKRKKEYDEANQRYEQKKAEKTLAERYAERDAEFMATILKEREDKLLEIKQQYKPFDLDSVNEHDRNFLEKLNQKEEERK